MSRIEGAIGNSAGTRTSVGTSVGTSVDVDALVAARAVADRPLAIVRHSLVLARRNIVKLGHTPESLMDVTLQPILFLLLFVYLFGGVVTGSARSYVRFLVPGVLVQSILLATVAIGVNLNVDVTRGVFDRFRSLPIARCAPLLGAVLAELVRYLIAVLATVGVGYVLGFRIGGAVLAAVAGCALVVGFALCVCWIPILIGLTARTPGAVQGVLVPVMFPLTFASNVFVPTGSLPGWLQAFVKTNPVSQLTSTTRGLLVSGPVARPLLWTALWMLGLLAVFFPAALRAYRTSG